MLVFQLLNNIKKSVRFSILLTLIFTVNAFAQLSPGDLHKSHADLEGVENCTKCHESGQKLNPDKCLDCHKILKSQINANKGLHANKDYVQCENCHIEHQGRDYDLVFWKNGQDAFDHKLTGYKLESAHSKLKCNECHKAANIKDSDTIRKAKKDPDKTFLGLKQECLSCHHDEHRGQLDKKCLTCHKMDAWKPAPDFNHDKTGYPLTGLHKNVECKACHKTVIDNKFPKDDSFLKFAKIQHNLCTDCHKDVHNNKFGNNCTKCHNTSGWKNYDQQNFNHSKTRYPLKGKHINVRCESCHKPGKPVQIAKFQNCNDCHSDFHKGQFLARKQKGACEECHSVDGFAPSAFTIDMHQQSDFKLQGSHLAVPCFACHKTINREKMIQFQFTSMECISCHEDVHKGKTLKFVTNQNASGDMCAYCHTVSSWREIEFDHSKTGFVLEGRHLKTQCGKCHLPENKDNWIFKGTAKECLTCHEDIHQGQFIDADSKLDCGRCHTPIDWLAEKFDHERDSNFSLKGGHKFVPCSGCHKPENRNGIEVVKYKPVNTKCESCHK